MRGDTPAAALRLAQSLTCRTHEARAPARIIPPQSQPGATAKRGKPGRAISLYGNGRSLKAAKHLQDSLPVHNHKLVDDEEKRKWGTQARPVRVNGRVYQSMRSAAEALGVSITAISKWIDTGRATYAQS